MSVKGGVFFCGRGVFVCLFVFVFVFVFFFWGGGWCSVSLYPEHISPSSITVLSLKVSFLEFSP